MKYALIGWLLTLPIHIEFETLRECRSQRLFQAHRATLDCYAVRPGEQYTLLPGRQQ